MAAEQKKPDWKAISDERRRVEAARSAKLREERLARDAALPAPEPKKTIQRRVKKPA